MTTREFPDISFRLSVGRIPPDLFVWYLTPTIFLVNPFDGVHCLSHFTNLPQVECTGMITHIIAQIT